MGGAFCVRLLHDGPMSFAICGASSYCHQKFAPQNATKIPSGSAELRPQVRGLRGASVGNF